MMWILSVKRENGYMRTEIKKGGFEYKVYVDAKTGKR